MCGIVGYVGPREVSTVLIDGLKRLEYRGYDSCGIAVLDNGALKVVRTAGRVGKLEAKAQADWKAGNGVGCGIGHTRWATHGQPTENNAHPHCDCTGRFVVAHNGIIENHLTLRCRLSAQGHVFRTDTDTEVIPHLIEKHFHGSLENAVRLALSEAEGAYSIVVLSACDRSKIVAARRGAPIVVGVGEDETFVASDAPAIVPYTKDLLFVDDGELAIIQAGRTQLFTLDGKPVSRRPQRTCWDLQAGERNGYPHFMLKEIFEQPKAVADSLAGRFRNDAVDLEPDFAHPEVFSDVERIYLVACGTSLHAALVGKFLIESLAGIAAEVDYASEFRYREPVFAPRSVVVGITQSGETADTVGALEAARHRGVPLAAICNVMGSLISRQCDNVLYTRAGPEIGVASTKAFTTQLVMLYVLALWLGQQRKRLPAQVIEHRIAELKGLPAKMERALGCNLQVQELAESFSCCRSALFLGRGINYPIAMEGALKLKEVSYIHAEGYPSGEMKHGPIALIDGEMPVVCVAPCDPRYRKMLANVEEVAARKGKVTAVISEGDGELSRLASHAIAIPPVHELLNPVLAVLPLQLLAYHSAVTLGRDVDKPRNLAKSVTVE